MTDELVDSIVRQVMEALRSQGVAAPAAVAPSAPAAPAAGLIARAAAGNGKPAPPQKVFLTADMLERRLAVEPADASGIELAENEFLTPAARDLAEECHVTVRKAPPALPGSPAPTGGGANGSPKTTVEALADSVAASTAGPPAGAGAVGLVVERPDSTVRSVLAGLAHDGISLVDYSQTDCWIVNTRLLCEAVVSRAVGAGVAILPYAADAMALAGKVRGIRPTQGTRPDSVAAAIRHFAANLLVLEHAFSTYHEMRAMVRLFAGDRPAAPDAKVLMDAIDELEAT